MHLELKFSYFFTLPMIFDILIFLRRYKRCSVERILEEHVDIGDVVQIHPGLVHPDAHFYRGVFRFWWLWSLVANKTSVESVRVD